ncbi:MAG TPA: hypothetical protein VHD56_18775 [Tepidisphaeraceae bacterium]|nr:hypothetical protein [Tepidisphaeraceae bacterium]
MKYRCELSRGVPDRNNVAALLVKEDNPMQMVDPGYHVLHWSTSFPACNVDLGNNQLGLSRALIELELTGLKCMSSCHWSLPANMEWETGSSEDEEHGAKASGTLSGPGAKVSGALSSKRGSKHTSSVGAKETVPTYPVKQLTGGENPTWEYLPVDTAARAFAAGSVLDYVADLHVHLAVDEASKQRRGMFKFRAKPEDLMVINKRTRQPVDSNRLWNFLALLWGRKNLVEAYGTREVSLHEIRVEFFLASVDFGPKEIPVI